MATITKGKTWADNENVTYTDLNGNFDTIYNEFNGLISNANISATAAIATTKISGTAATLAGAEVLTNKTITSPVIRSWDGWMDANESWTYASATTITVPSGATSKYQKGDKIKLTQTTAKYFYIVGVADTVLTITGGSDYTLANAAITSPYYSKIANPQGFPSSFTWNPTLTGFSSNPTGTYRFSINGNICSVTVRQYVDGTSSTAALTITAPVTAATVSGMIWGNAIWEAVNNGTTQEDTGRAYIASAGTAFVLGVNNDTDAWTASGGKRASFQLSYEI